MHLRKSITIVLVALIAIGLPYTYHRVLIPSNYREFELPVSFDKIKSVELASIRANIYVKVANQGDGNIILSTLPELQKKLTVFKQGNVLKVAFKNTGNSYNDRSYLEIFIPSTIKVLNATSVSGDLDIEGTSLDNLLMETTSGDINLSHVMASKSVLTTVSGDIFWKGRLLSALISTVSGDVSLQIGDAFTGKINATSTSGNVSIPTNTPSGLDKVNINTVSGDIQVQ